jgi:hypothetical protein
LHKLARSATARLVAVLSATQAGPSNPGRDRALACYDAAALLAAEREDLLDLRLLPGDMIGRVYGLVVPAAIGGIGVGSLTAPALASWRGRLPQETGWRAT